MKTKRNVLEKFGLLRKRKKCLKKQAKKGQDLRDSGEFRSRNYSST
jgi:hypothetical protein